MFREPSKLVEEEEWVAPLFGLLRGPHTLIYNLAYSNVYSPELLGVRLIANIDSFIKWKRQWFLGKLCDYITGEIDLHYINGYGMYPDEFNIYCSYTTLSNTFKSQVREMPQDTKFIKVSGCKVTSWVWNWDGDWDEKFPRIKGKVGFIAKELGVAVNLWGQ